MLGQKLQAKAGACRSCFAAAGRPASSRLRTTHWSDSDPDPADVSPSAQLSSGRPGRLPAASAGRQLRWKGRRIGFRALVSDSCRWVDALCLLRVQTCLGLVAAGGSSAESELLRPVRRRQQRLARAFAGWPAAKLLRWAHRLGLPPGQGNLIELSARVPLKPAVVGFRARSPLRPASCKEGLRGRRGCREAPSCTCICRLGGKPVRPDGGLSRSTRKLSPFTDPQAASAIRHHAQPLQREHPPATSPIRDRLLLYLIKKEKLAMSWQSTATVVRRIGPAARCNLTCRKPPALFQPPQPPGLAA